MRVKYWVIAAAAFLVITVRAEQQLQSNTKTQSSSEKDSSTQYEGEEVQEAAQDDEKVETISADINFNSWSELYDYLKEIEEATAGGEELEEGQEHQIRLELMTDGDALSHDNDQGDEEQVIVHGTINDVIREVPAPDLSQGEVLIGDEEQAPPSSTKPRIVTTDTDWTFIQDTLKKLDNKETSQAKRAKMEEILDDGELTEEEQRGKEVYERAKQITTLTRANRKLAHTLFVEAAGLGYIPAKERVAWFQLLGSSNNEDLAKARKAFEELATLGRPDSHMVCCFDLHLKLQTV